MNVLNQIPDWLGTAILATAIAVLGFFGKELWTMLQGRGRRAAERQATLSRLQGLLGDSKSVFASQNYMARRLMLRLRERYPAEAQEGLGFDETFYRLFEKMNPEERELHSLIRSTTVNSMRRLNQELRAWLRENQGFRTPSKPTEAQTRFAQDLRELELHLNQWFDKYEALIPSDETRSLVYLADERRHGVGFPKQIARSLEGVKTELA